MRVLVLSPHRDDAAFSCGLVLRGLLASGAAPVIVNVCTISSYAPYLDQQSPVDQAQADLVTMTRRQEDDAFTARLAELSAVRPSALEMVDLAWKDAPLRWHIEEQRVLAPASLRKDEIDLLSSQLQAVPQADFILAPLSLGEHVDHRLVHQAALCAFPARQLLFYEDLPYACRLTAPERALASEKIKHLGSSCLLPVESPPGTKRDLALCYPSQVAAEVTEELEHYALSLNGRERFYGSPEALKRFQVLFGATGATQLP